MTTSPPLIATIASVFAIAADILFPLAAALLLLLHPRHALHLVAVARPSRLVLHLARHNALQLLLLHLPHALHLHIPHLGPASLLRTPTARAARAASRAAVARHAALSALHIFYSATYYAPAVRPLRLHLIAALCLLRAAALCLSAPPSVPLPPTVPPPPLPQERHQQQQQKQLSSSLFSSSSSQSSLSQTNSTNAPDVASSLTPSSVPQPPELPRYTLLAPAALDVAATSALAAALYAFPAAALRAVFALPPDALAVALTRALAAHAAAAAAAASPLISPPLLQTRRLHTRRSIAAASAFLFALGDVHISHIPIRPVPAAAVALVILVAFVNAALAACVAAFAHRHLHNKPATVCAAPVSATSGPLVVGLMSLPKRD